MTSRARARSTAARTGQRIAGPGELLQAVPYLLGFHPRESLVVVGLRAGILVVTARLDLPDAFPAGRADLLLRQTLAHMQRGGTDEIVAVMYTSARSANRDARDRAARLVASAEATPCTVGDVLLVGVRRWWSLQCDEPECCDPAGRPFEDGQSPFTAAATVDGIVPMPDRQALIASLDPDSDVATRQPLVDAERVRSDPAPVRDVLAAARAADRPEWSPPGDAELARLAVAVRDIDVRDALWFAIDERRVDGCPLWRALITRMPAPFDASPALLFGWASWRAGDGALARIAADRAVSSDPHNGAADLLVAALSQGLDPYTFPPLRQHAG